MKKLREYLLQDPWFHSEVQENWVVILQEQNCILKKEWLYPKERVDA